MKYMLDTNICIYLIKQQPREVTDIFREIALGEIAISTVTVAEMMCGVVKSQHMEKNKAALQAFLAPLGMVDFDFAAAQQYGVVRAYLDKIGKPIGAYDLMIASHALSLGLILVTDNDQEFQRISDLIVENWVKK